MQRHAPGIAAALPCAIAALVYLVTWIRPETLGDTMVRDLLLLMMMEFIMMHASVMMSAIPRIAETRTGRMVAVVLLAVLYSAFGVGVPLWLGVPWFIVHFAALVGGRFWAARQLPDARQEKVQLIGWAVAILAYLLFMVCSAIPFPRFGIPDGPVDLYGSEWQNPQRVIGAGFLYWSALATALYFLHRLPAASDAPCTSLRSGAPSPSGQASGSRGRSRAEGSSASGSAAGTAAGSRPCR